MGRTKPGAVGEFYMQVSRKKRVLVLEELNFLWDEPELDEMADMWERELSVWQISRHFKRDPDEILLALIHLARQEEITQRKGGLFGI